MAAPISVYIETGEKRTFACAVAWPGWARSGRDEGAALGALAEYAPRYARVADRAGLPWTGGSADLAVVERVRGGAATDFGAPQAVPRLDGAPLSGSERERLATLLRAAWEELAIVAAAAPAALRKGPRGGGRDRDAIVEHVVEAERSYARKLDVRMTAAEWSAGGITELRSRLLEVIRHGRAAEAGAPRWPVGYLVRRTAWHALDHAWEIEDRAEG